MPSLERQATALGYLLGEIEGLRIYCRRECLDDVCERLDRIEYTARRLAQEPKSPLKELGYAVVLEPEK